MLEIMLAMSLLVLLSSMTYWFYSSSLETRRRGTQAAYELRLCRVVLDRITREIRQAANITAEGRVGLRGKPERIWLTTTRVPTCGLNRLYEYSEESPPGKSDVVKAEYKITRHPEILDDDGYELALGLARVEIEVPRPDSAETGEAFEGERRMFDTGGEEDASDDVLADDELSEDGMEEVGLASEIHWEELYAPEIRYLRFCYYDGYRWWNEWDIAGENPLPQLVQVTVGLEGHPAFGEKFGTTEDEEFCTCLNEDPVDCLPLPEDQFTTVVRLPQSDPLFRSRVIKETQSLMKLLSGEEEGEEEED